MKEKTDHPPAPEADVLPVSTTPFDESPLPAREIRNVQERREAILSFFEAHGR
ncbi:MAG: hypothetical protein AAB853_01880 [Patescibacteria group bacterium]